MNKGKKFLAVFCAMVLALNVFSGMPVKGAGEVNVTLSYNGFGDQPNVSGGRWLIKAKLDTAITATIPSNQYIGWVKASVNNSAEEITLDVYASATDQIFFPMKYANVNAGSPSEVPVGTTVTMKARTLSGYVAIQSDLTIYWTGSAWKELQNLPLSTISSQQQVVLTTTNTTLQTLFDGKGSTSDMPLTGVNGACVRLNGNATSKTTVNYSKWGLYLDASSIKGSNYVTGDEIWIEGVFSQSVNSNILYYFNEGFVCIATSDSNGATWAYKGVLSVKSNSAATLYLEDTQGLNASGSAYNVFNAAGATIKWNNVVVTRNAASSGNYMLYQASQGAFELYAPNYYNADGVQMGKTYTVGDILYVGGTFNCNGKRINYGDNWFILQSDGTWLHTTEEPETSIDFVIEGATCTYQDWSNLNRWAISLTTSEKLGAPEALTYIGERKILVGDVQHKASFYMKPDGMLQFFVGKAIIPQSPDNGLRLTIPAQEIQEECNLTADYRLIYDNGWKEIEEYAEVSLAVHGSWGTQSNAATLMPAGDEAVATNASLKLQDGVYLRPITTDAGIWYNGKRLNSAKGLKLINGSTFVRYQVILADYALTVSAHDIITVKGLFGTNGVYLDMTEYTVKYNGNNWEKISYKYEDLNQITINHMLSAGAQDHLSRWLLRLEPSEPLESMGGDFKAYNGGECVSITVYDASGNNVGQCSSYAYASEESERTGNLGLIIPFSSVGNSESYYGYSIEIAPTIFSGNSTYYFMNKPVKLLFENGKWEFVHERPTASGVKGDANGDGVRSAEDIVRIKRELAGMYDENGIIILSTEDAMTTGRTSILRKVDLVSLSELILRDGEKGKLPIYLQDDKIMLAAYEGPRKANGKDYTLNGLNISGTEVEEGFITKESFETYAASGLNTLITQADCSFNSFLLYHGGPGYWDNLTQYMTLAEQTDLDVIVYSNMLDLYLKDEQTTNEFNGNTVDVNLESVKAEVKEMWGGITIGNTTYRGMKDYGNFAGILMSDELKTATNYLSALRMIRSDVSEDMGFFSSQFAMDSSAISNFGGSNSNAQFVNQALAFGVESGNFVYDMYPFRSTGSSTNKTKDTWLLNLQLSAETGRDNGFDTGITIQSSEQRRGLLLTEYLRGARNVEDIGFQVYTALAYGMSSLTYYTYWEHHHQFYESGSGEWMPEAMVVYSDSDGDGKMDSYKTTAIYEAVKTVNNRINKMDHVFMEYDWLGTIPLTGNNSAGLFNNLTTYTHASVTATATNDALIGCMRDETQGYDGFWLVNATAPNYAKDSTITVKFDGAKELMVYNPQEADFSGHADVITYDATNGYTVTLGCGEGQFVIPLY